uniref:Uncharacterized protein n=1 Tax=Knipowitschia caucasica TaxID=637954 RepID=A0AAV2JNJ6_KNICA
MLPVCLGDWGDWCHGVLEPLKCRPSVNMTKARPALSPGADTVRAALTGAVESQIDTYSTALAACALTLYAAVAAVVAGCVVPQCQGHRGGLSQQTHTEEET